MQRFAEELKSKVESNQVPVIIGPYGDIRPPGLGKVLALAPHPDDPESVACTLRWFAESGCTVIYAIMTSGHSGVDDKWACNKAGQLGFKFKNERSLAKFKSECRRQEQLESARLAGFVSSEPVFLDTQEDSYSKIIDNSENLKILIEFLGKINPDVVILPHGNDKNHDHRLVYRMFCNAVKLLKLKPVIALFNRDPKTIQIEKKVVYPYSEIQAGWKASLLRAHESQHERNLAQRGTGFDQRILDCDQECWKNTSEEIKKHLRNLEQLHRCESFDIAFYS